MVQCCTQISIKLFPPYHATTEEVRVMSAHVVLISGNVIPRESCSREVWKGWNRNPRKGVAKQSGKMCVCVCVDVQSQKTAP